MSLLYSVETFLRTTRIPPSRFGREAVKDPRLVHDLRRGRQPGAALEKRVRKHIAEMLLRHLGPTASGVDFDQRSVGQPVRMTQGDC